MGTPPAEGASRRMNPAVWTALGAVVGAALAYDWGRPAALRFDVMLFLMVALVGAFVTIVVAAWPRVRSLPTAPCPRCGHAMKWDVVVCPECGEIR